MDRNDLMKRIKGALQRRSGKAWSVIGGRGTAYGWIKIAAPPARMTWGYRRKEGKTPSSPGDWTNNWEAYDRGEPGHGMSPEDQAELVALLGKDRIHHQGESIPAGSDYYQEYLDRAEGREPARVGVPYWD